MLHMILQKTFHFLYAAVSLPTMQCQHLKTPKSYIYYGNGELDGNYSERRQNNFQIVTDALLTYKKTFLTILMLLFQPV